MPRLQPFSFQRFNDTTHQLFYSASYTESITALHVHKARRKIKTNENRSGHVGPKLRWHATGFPELFD